MIYVAGSGPSSKGHRKAHVVTKKKVKWECEHIVVPRSNWVTEAIQDKVVVWTSYPRKDEWEKYFAQFCAAKPSNGLQAVFVAIDKYEPDEITLIGFDNVLNEAKATQHKWAAEKKCIESLVRVIAIGE